MTLTIQLRPETEQRLRERAARSGQEPAALVQDLVERELSGSATLAEILAPFRAEVAASGINDAELTCLFDEARKEAASTSNK